MRANRWLCVILLAAMVATIGCGRSRQNLRPNYYADPCCPDNGVLLPSPAVPYSGY